MCVCVCVRSTLYAYTHICAHNAMVMIPSLSILPSLCDCAVGSKTGATTHCSETHDLSTIRRKMPLLTLFITDHHFSVLLLLLFVFLCDICWGFGSERECAKHNTETVNVVDCMTFTNVHKQNSRLQSSLFGLVPFLMSCMWRCNTMGL